MDMDMSTGASSTMNMASMTAMSSASTASGTAASSMDMGSTTSGMMGMSDMMMVFFTATDTPLYSSTWAPPNVGSYVGTCIFLIVLSVIFRGIVAVRCNFALLWARWSRKRRTDVLEYEHEEAYMKQKSPSWSVNEAAARAALDTILAGVSYLLMLAVMTMNVGYFMAVLGGTFLGSFILGGWTGTSAH